jgi:hypothetical protein
MAKVGVKQKTHVFWKPGQKATIKTHLNDKKGAELTAACEELAVMFKRTRKEVYNCHKQMRKTNGAVELRRVKFTTAEDVKMVRALENKEGEYLTEAYKQVAADLGRNYNSVRGRWQKYLSGKWHVIKVTPAEEAKSDVKAETIYEDHKKFLHSPRISQEPKVDMVKESLDSFFALKDEVLEKLAAISMMHPGLKRMAKMEFEKAINNL